MIITHCISPNQAVDIKNKLGVSTHWSIEFDWFIEHILTIISLADLRIHGIPTSKTGDHIRPIRNIVGNCRRLHQSPESLHWPATLLPPEKGSLSKSSRIFPRPLPTLPIFPEAPDHTSPQAIFTPSISHSPIYLHDKYGLAPQ